MFCIRQILEKKWENNEAVHQLFINFKQVYDSVRREALYNILIEFGIPLKLVIIHSFIPLACAEFDDSLPVSGASSISLDHVLFPATLLN
jgi:hypothetical protein